MAGSYVDLPHGSSYYALSAMSDRALAYDDEPLVHRMIVIYESAGFSSEIASYLIRSLLSEGRIDYVTVVKTKGGLASKRITRQGPTGLITTTTAVALHPENETRLLSVTVSDSAEQTRQIMLAHAHQTVRVRDLGPWHELQTFLANLAVEVDVPFATSLAEAIPPVAVRLRRDFPTLLTLIRAHALLHGVRRERDSAGRVVATIADYEQVRDLVSDLLADASERAIPSTVRDTVAAVRVLADECDPVGDGVSVTAIAESLGVDKSTALRRTRVAIARGALHNLEGHRGRPARIVLGDPLPENRSLLPGTAELERLHGCSPPGDAIDLAVDLDYPASAWRIDTPTAGGLVI